MVLYRRFFTEVAFWRQSLTKLEKFVVGFSLLALLAGWLFHGHPQRQPAEVSAPTEVAIPTTPVRGDNKVVVGANPRLNPNQVFLPPADSVVITNKEHLRAVMENSRPASK